MTRLSDEVVVVTGASRGMGREMALRFSREGARVVLVSRTRKPLEDVAEEAPHDTLVVPADVRDHNNVTNATDKALEEFGRIDVLVNNAGVSLLGLQDAPKRMVDVSEEEWDQVLDTNLKGVYLFSKSVIPHMAEAGEGNVVNVSSGLGRHAVQGASPYIASKWGLEGFTRAVALEHEGRVNVNALSPGGQVNTRIWDHLPKVQRESILQPDVMNEAAVLLAEQSGDGVTGESLTAREWEERLG